MEVVYLIQCLPRRDAWRTPPPSTERGRLARPVACFTKPLDLIDNFHKDARQSGRVDVTIEERDEGLTRSHPSTTPTPSSLVTPSTIGGAIIGGVAGGSILGPMGAIAGLVVGAVAGEVIDSGSRKGFRRQG